MIIIKTYLIFVKHFTIIKTIRNAKYSTSDIFLSLSDENVREREIGNLLLIDDNIRKIVVTADKLLEPETKGVEIWNIRNFLSTFFQE